MTHCQILRIMNMQTLEKVKNEAMTLSDIDKAVLAHAIISSIDYPGSNTLGVKYEKEIKHRVQMVHEGTATGRPVGDVFSDIKARWN